MKPNQIITVVVLILALTFTYCAAQVTDKEIPVTTTSNQARVLYNKGLDMYDRYRYDDGRKQFREAVQIDSTLAMGHYQIASTPGDNKEGSQELNKALALTERVSEGERLLIQALKAAYDGNQEKQIELLRKAIALYPGERRSRIALAGLLSGRDKDDDAIAEINAVLRIDPRFASSYNQLGYIQAKREQYAEAEKALKTYTELVPDEANPYDSYGEILMKQGKHDESIAAYQKALSIDPKFSWSHTGLANNYMFKGMPAKARQEAQQQYDLATTDEVRRTALWNKMMTYLYEGRYDKALEVVTQRYELAMQKGDSVAASGDLGLMGSITLEMAGMDVTKGTYLKTRTPEPNKVQEAKNLWAKSNAMAMSSSTAGEWKERIPHNAAIGEAEIALRTNDLLAAKAKTEEFATFATQRKEPWEIRTVHYLRGRIALAEKRYEDALAELNQTDLRNPNNLYWLMEVYTAVGDTERAKEFRSKILNVKDNSTDLAYTLQKIRSQEPNR